MPRRDTYGATDSQQYAHAQTQHMYETVGAPPAPGTPVYLDSPSPSPGIYGEKSYGDSQTSFIHANQSREQLYNHGKPPITPRSPPSRPTSGGGKRKAIVTILAIIGVLALVGAVIGALVATKVIKFNTTGTNSNLAAAGASGSASATAGSPTAASAPASTSAAASTQAQTGGDGSMVTSIDGTQTFRYNNSQGGTWDAVPFSNRAQAQADTPPLSQPFDYNVNRQRGVNFGGWLNLEPFITPALYEPFVGTATPAVDEWSLSLALDAQGPSVKQATFERHFSTFITEIDFAQVAGYGLNYIRLPVPFWMIETYPGEPFYTGQWPYFLKAIAWARKYGLRIQLDYHAAPGSQNGWNHSGRLGQINWLRGPMGLANAQRSLNHLRTLMQFISQPQYSNVVAQITLMNEPRGQTTAIGPNPIMAFYAQAYQMMRAISGTGPGAGPMIMLGEGFIGPAEWANFLPTADRLGLDFHTYMAFDTPQPTGTIASHVARACDVGANFRTGASLISAGEFSLGVNDCGLMLNGVGSGANFAGTYAAGTGIEGTCATWTTWEAWTADTKAQYTQLFNAWTDATYNGFFWTWKIGQNSAGLRRVPAWDYSLGVENGWIPRAWSNTSTCNLARPPALPVNQNLGQAGAAPAIAQYAWPPRMLSVGRTTFAYAATAPIITMPAPTVSVAAGAPTPISSPGNGWFNAADTVLMYGPAGATPYPDAWGSVEPGGSTILRRSPRPTPPPHAHSGRH